MPLFLTLAIISIITANHYIHHHVVGEVRANQAVVVEAERVGHVISELLPVFEWYEWDHRSWTIVEDCPLLVDCTYTPQMDPPVYFDTADWRTDLIPEYMFEPYMPTGWTFDFKGYDGLTQTASSIHACITVAAVTDRDLDLLLALHDQGNPNTEFGASCEPASPLTKAQILSHTVGQPMYLTHYLHTF